MNRLNNIFSDNEIEFVGNLKFDNKETRKKYINNLLDPFNSMTPFKINGVDSLKLIEDENSYPIIQNKINDPFERTKENNKETIPLTLKNGQNIKLNKKITDEYIIINTNIDNFIDLSLIFSISNENIKFTYSLNLISETDCNKIKLGIKSLLLLLDSAFNTKENNKALQTTLSFLEDLYLYFYLLVEIERELSINFNYSDSIDFKNKFDDVIELYVFLKQKEPIRDDSKVDVTVDYDGLLPKNHKLKVGLKLALGGTLQKQYELYDRKITLCLVQILYNCIVKDVKNIEDNSTVIIESQDSKPIYTSYCGFRKKVDINNLFESNKNLINDYKDAQPLSYHHEKLLEEIVESLYN